MTQREDDMVRRIELLSQQFADMQVVLIRVDTNVDHARAKLDDVSARQDEHSARISDTAGHIARWQAMKIDDLAVGTDKTVSDWKSKANLILAVASFVGIGGLASMLALVAKLYSF